MVLFESEDPQPAVQTAPRGGAEMKASPFTVMGSAGPSTAE